MAESLSKHQRNLSAIIHASTFSRFFFPFGNFLLPLILWMANRKDYSFVDYNGKQALNFQISLLLYSVILCLLMIPIFIGLLPPFMDEGLFHWNEWHGVFDMNIDYSIDSLNLSRFIWPVGLAGLLQAGLFLVNIVYTILATLRSNDGEYFQYPLTIQFIK